MQWCKLSLVGLLGCGASAPPAGDAGELTIVDEQTSAEEPPPEALTPSADPATTCVRVADRLAACTTERAALVLDDLPPSERADAEAVLKAAALGIEHMREQCRGALNEADAAYVQAMGRCLDLPCPALRECVDSTP